MSVKIFEVDGIGPVKLQKRKGTRSLRLSLTPQGEVKVSLPTWVPYRLGVEFAKNKQTWILKHRFQPSFLSDGQVVGKAHRLVFVASLTASRASSHVAAQRIRVTYPASWRTADRLVQQAAQRGALRAVQTEAEALLPGRLKGLARQHGYSYSALRLKHLRAKWGSCNHRAEITLNVFLMTLPWDLIDYVLLHELVHTKVLRHGEPFWRQLAQHMPHVQALRKRLRDYQPTFSTP
jgi:predicted metal-dependent hydrolase